MLLAIDIGNTTINIGLFKKDRLILIRKINTRKSKDLKYYHSAFAPLIQKMTISDVIISSVVPEVTNILKRVFKEKLNLKPRILGQNCRVPITNLYKNPKQVGQDRLVNAYAGYKKFGGGLIIIDFGTAVTFDVVSRKGSYEGGIISPGLEPSVHTLSKMATLLPVIKLKKPRSLIGRDTYTSMLSGVLNGYGALCSGLIVKIRKEMRSRFKTILTGGHARLISKFCDFDYIEPNLTLEGLRSIHKFLLTKSAKSVK